MKIMEGRRRRNTRWTLTEDHFPFLHYSPGTEDNRKQTPSSTADSTLFYIFSTWGITGETATSSFVLTTEPSSTQLLIAQVCSTPLLRDGERFTWHPLLCMLPFRLSEDFPSNPPSRNTKKKKRSVGQEAAWTAIAQLSCISSHPLPWIVLFCLKSSVSLLFTGFLFIHMVLNISLVSPSILFCLHNPLIKTLGRTLRHVTLHTKNKTSQRAVIVKTLYMSFLFVKAQDTCQNTPPERRWRGTLTFKHKKIKQY